MVVDLNELAEAAGVVVVGRLGVAEGLRDEDRESAIVRSVTTDSTRDNKQPVELAGGGDSFSVWMRRGEHLLLWMIPENTTKKKW